MQGKKKPGAVKKSVVKKKTVKLINDHSDTINTTKQKTFTTIQQTFEFQDHKTSTRTTHNTSKRDCIDRMQANKMSPFSSPGKSVSPKNRKCFSPIVVKQIKAKKHKKSQLSQLSSIGKKQISIGMKAHKAQKSKDKNVQSVKAQFQNQFLKRLHKLEQFNEKKITELSQQQMEASIRKLSKPVLGNKKQIRQKKNKKQVIKQMHLKIKQKYGKIYPNLKSRQLKLLSAVVLIQRLWRQTKVKSMISSFLSPRSSLAAQIYQQTFGKIQIKNLNSSNSFDQSRNQQTQKINQMMSPKIAQDDHEKPVLQLSSISNNSQIFATPQKSEVNLKELQISDEFSDTSSSKASQFLKYVDMYRQVTLKNKKEKKKKRNAKPNAFNFPQSLSQKCLLQSLYKKRVKKIKSIKQKSCQKIETSQIFFPIKSLQKSKEQYISPKKPEIMELQQRFYTEAQDQQYLIAAKIQKQAPKIQDQTISTLGNIALKILEEIVQQFSEQFQAFTSKKCLKKKKRLPGIFINDQTISFYLKSFIKFVNKQYQGHLQQSFTKISGKNFLKFLRIPSQQELFASDQKQQSQEELNFPVLPSTAFFQYQPIYQNESFKIKQQDSKYSNFLSGLIKIHNKCLADSFSDFIEKQRLESIQFPWDKISPMKSQQKIASQISKKIDARISQIQKRIILISNTKLGKLHKKDPDVQQLNLLKSLKEDYKREGKDWSEHQQLLQIRLQLSQLLMLDLTRQFAQQMNNFNA